MGRAECDVEEPDAQIFLKPSIEKRYPVTISVSQIELPKYNFCGRCAQARAYNAIAAIGDSTLLKMDSH